MTSEPDQLLATLKRAAGVLKQAGIPFALAGSYAIYARGGPDSEHDVDFALLEEDAEKAAALLTESGFRVEHPPEDWLLKVYDDGRMVDLLWRVGGMPVTADMLERADDIEVSSVLMPVLNSTDCVIGMLRAFSHHHCDFSAVLPKVRAMREQVDWDRVWAECNDSPFAYAFLVLLERLRVIAESGKETPDA